jgi:hypothetical protein
MLISIGENLRHEVETGQIVQGFKWEICRELEFMATTRLRLHDTKLPVKGLMLVRYPTFATFAGSNFAHCLTSLEQVSPADVERTGLSSHSSSVIIPVTILVRVSHIKNVAVKRLGSSDP